MDTTYFDPLARGENVLPDNHAYSYVNALCSAMQAWFVMGSEKHLRAARNGFDFLAAQSFATGGWGPDEQLRKPGLGEVAASLTRTHNHFEVPCGGYAHMKLTRYLLRATRDGRYGDSMERVMLNATLGSLPLQPDGRSFYYADYGGMARRVYSNHRWPCCSGTLPQLGADYGINTYLRSPGIIWVNLYLTSVLRWSEGGAQLSLEQDGAYPATSQVRLRVSASKPAAFTLKLRIPAWAPGARLSVNGKPAPVEPQRGFATLTRTWRSGDTVELDLPLTLRLEPIDDAHPGTAALMAGPLVLFAVGGQQAPITGAQAMSARQVAPKEWRIDTASSTLRLVPFPEVGETTYSTYLNLT